MRLELWGEPVVSQTVRLDVFIVILSLHFKIKIYMGLAFKMIPEFSHLLIYRGSKALC